MSLPTRTYRFVCHLVMLCVVFGFALPTGVMAQTEVANDSFDTSQQGTIASAQLITSEMYAATFTIPVNFLPAELLGVRVVMIDGDDPQKSYCGRFTIEVWNDDLSIPPALSPNCPIVNQRPVPGAGFGAPLYSMSAQFSGNIGFQVQGDRNNYQDLLFSSINNNPQLMATISPVILTQSEVRVGLKAIDLQCGATAADAYPLMLTDLDGEASSGTNYLYGYFDGLCPANFEFLLWKDMAQFLSTQPGDFVMRLLLRAQGGGDMDMGVMDMMMQDMMRDMAPDMMDEEDMFMVVDMMPDGSMVDMQVAPDMADAQDMMQGGQDMSAPADQGGGVALELTNISPSSMKQGAGGEVVLLGKGFAPGAEVRLDARQIGVLETRTGRILATLPTDLDVGRYDVIVTNPNGDSVILSMGFEVIEEVAQADMNTPVADLGSRSGGDVASPDEEGCGCQSTHAPARRNGALLWWLVGVVGMVWRRRRET